MSFTDLLVGGLTKFLVRTLLRPRLHFVDKDKQGGCIPAPSIIIINHTSHLDGPVVNTVFRHNVIHNLAAKDRFAQRGFGFFLRHTGCIPIDRRNPDITWVHTALDVLHKDRECVAIYPEGRHGSHRQQLPFHSGVVMLAAVAQVPVVMVYIDGPFKIPGRRAELIVAPPFRMDPPKDGLNSDYIAAQTLILQDKMKDLMETFIRTTE